MSQMTYRVEEKARNKKPVLFALSAALVLALAGGGTFAYLSVTTAPKDNVFTAPNSTIAATLTEPKWDAAGGGSTVASNMTPGTDVDKDPQMNNTNKAGGEEEYFAVQVSFEKATGPSTFAAMTQAEVDDLMKGVAIGDTPNATTPGFTPNAKWTRGDGGTGVTPKMEYYFDSKVAPAASTDPIFTKLTIIPTAGNAAWTNGGTVDAGNFMTWLTGSFTGGQFRVVVQGAAVQASGIPDAATANTTLKTLF